MQRSRRSNLLLAAAFTAALLMTAVPAAHAEAGARPQDGSDITQSTYQVVNRRLVSSSYLGPVIGLPCSTAVGGSCTISISGTYTRQAQGGVGATAAWASANLGISTSRSITLSTTCNSPVFTSATRYSTWKARLLGSRYSYQIQRTDWIGGVVVGRSTSSTLYAFQPTTFRCGW